MIRLHRNVFSVADKPFGTRLCFEVMNDDRKGAALVIRVPVVEHNHALLHGIDLSGKPSECISHAAYCFEDLTDCHELPIYVDAAKRKVRQTNASLNVAEELRLYKAFCNGRTHEVWEALELWHRNNWDRPVQEYHPI